MKVIDVFSHSLLLFLLSSFVAAAPTPITKRVPLPEAPELLRDVRMT